MNIWFYIAICFFLGVIVYWIGIIITFWKKRRLPLKKKLEFIKLLKQINSEKNARQKIIDYDKLYHKILLAFGYEWDFWEILKFSPNEVWDTEKVWQLHKFRNKLVHEFDNYKDSDLKKKADSYRKEVLKLLR